MSIILFNNGCVFFNIIIKSLKWDISPRPTDLSPISKDNHLKTTRTIKRTKRTIIFLTCLLKNLLGLIRIMIPSLTNSNWSTKLVTLLIVLLWLARKLSRIRSKKHILSTSLRITQMISSPITAKLQWLVPESSQITWSAPHCVPRWSTGWSKCSHPTRWANRRSSAASTSWIRIYTWPNKSSKSRIYT